MEKGAKKFNGLSAQTSRAPTKALLLKETASELRVHIKFFTIGARSTFQMTFHRDGVTEDELGDDLGFKECDDDNAR